VEGEWRAAARTRCVRLLRASRRQSPRIIPVGLIEYAEAIEPDLSDAHRCGVMTVPVGLRESGLFGDGGTPLRVSASREQASASAPIAGSARDRR
jgi:hypothetical protein